MKKYFLRRKNFIKLLIFFDVFIISLSLISVNIPSMTITKKIDNENINFFDVDDITSDGLAPVNNNIPLKSDIKSNDLSMETIDDCYEMYGYKAYPSPEKTIYFNTCEPQTIQELGGTISEDFLAGGTFGCDGVWYGCQYGNGLLYGIDPYGGDMWSIGGGGAGLNALAYNPVDNKMYGVDGYDNLYQVDSDTGEQDLIGNIDYSGGLMIGMAFDYEGVLYGWDLIDDKLWIIEIDTLEAIEIGSLGINLNFAQDGDFHRHSDTLYLTAYTSGGKLYKCDKNTGECTFIGNFEDNMEVTASIFLNCCFRPQHDIEVLEINKPENSIATPNIPMQITVKNRGNNTETTDLQMQVIKFEEEQVIYYEDFSGEFPPEGWETDYWNKSHTNNSGGEPPEARCYNLDQYYGGQYYNNYIKTGPINCTGLNKINIRFKWAAFYEYPQYCSVYVKFRNNSLSKWKDITPWENPVENNQQAQIWETSYYSLDEPLGNECQLMWMYTGYYYYFNYLWLDDIEIFEFNTSEEYNETIEDIEIAIGEEIQIDFPTWTPADWENTYYEDIWQDYNIYACSLLEDDIPKNDFKNKIINLYFPLSHDIELTSIDSPCKDGPGKTYPVKTTIKNVGKNTECCITLDIKIAEQTLLDSIFSEDFSSGQCPPPGWIDEHDEIAHNYGWRISNTTYSGGASPEAYIPYYRCVENYKFYSYAIDTSEYQKYSLNFKSYIDHYSGNEYYSLNAGWSNDLENWYSAWNEKPKSSRQFDVSVTIDGGSDTTYIGLWVTGNPNHFNYWYIDDIELRPIDLSDEEYSDIKYYESEIEPGEEVIIDFDEWKPDFLQYETTGEKNYIVLAEIDVEGDLNHENDLKAEEFTLSYWHDVKVKELISPSGYNGKSPYNWLHYDNEYFQDSYGLENGGTFEYAIRLTPDELKNFTGGYIFTIKRNHGKYSSYEMSGKMKIYGQGTSDNPGELLSETPFQGILNDWHEVKLSDPIKIKGNEDLWISVECTHKAGEEPALGDYDGPEYGKSDWLFINGSWIEAYTLGFFHDWMLQAGCLVYGSPYVYIQPGNEKIEALVENNGTFPELDLVCSTKIYEHITNCSNGTFDYEHIIGDIDLIEPVGGTELLSFDDYIFSNEGPYNLFVNIPDEDDDLPFNNLKMMGVRVDDSPPIVYYTIDPPEPDGKNDWYITSPTITFNAIDPPIGCGLPGSGIKEIRYSIDGGAQQVIPGGFGSFVLTDNGENIQIEFWPVDNVGNVGMKTSFTIDIDQTVPDISLTYAVTGGTNLTGWKYTFTVTAVDAISGMDYVEFLLNGRLQKTVQGDGPEYKWIVKLPKGIESVIKAIAYDKSGLSDSDEIVDPESESLVHIKNSILFENINNLEDFINILYLKLLEKFPILYKIIINLRGLIV